MTEQRRESRHECSLAVEVDVAGRRQYGTTINISQGGALVMTMPYPALGERVVLCIQLPGVQDVSEIPAFVRWVREGVGVGLTD